MLSISPIGAGSEAAGYANYQESEVAAAREDYYAAEGGAGHWTGKAAQGMGLTGELKPGQLLAGLQGFHPETGEALSRNAGEKHKGGWDLTFSAPKSVSCVWAVLDPETRAAMESAQDASAARALQLLEESGAFTSRSRNESGPVEGVAAAMYRHGTSREADPQLHTHVAVLNVQPDGTAMDFDARWKMAAGAVYRAELAAAMQKLGFQIEADGKSFRIVGVPESVEKEFSRRRAQIEERLSETGHSSAKAAAVAAAQTRKSKELTTRDELFADWETRAAAHGFTRESVQAMRNEASRDHELQHTPSPENGLDFIDQKKEQAHEQPDRDATDPDRSRAQLHGGLRQSNAAKIGIDTGALRWAAFLVGIDPPPRARNHLRWLPELGMVRISDGSTVLLPRDVPDHVVQQTAERADPLRRGSDGELDYSAILSEITQQASTVTPMQLTNAVAVAMQGKGDANAIEKALRDLQKHPDLIRLEADKPHKLRRGDETEIRYTTREMLEIEQGILDKSEARQAETRHRADTAAAIAARPTITQEQIDALRHVCEAPGAVKVVEGMAGTGKSYMLGAAREAWEAAGFEVIGTALQGKAKSGLQASAGITSHTCHSLLWQLDHGARELTSKSIVVVDEAGMVGSRQTARLLDYIHKAGAKVVLVGDRGQLPPIDAGGAFRLLSERLGPAWLKNIIRQKNADTVIEDRQVVKQFATGQAAAALQSLRERGLLKITETRAQAMQEMVRDWAQARDPSKPGEALMVAATRAEVAQLNAMARQGLKAESHLAGGLQVPTADGMKEFAPGDRIIFRQNNAAVGVSNGELGTVQNVKFDRTGQVEITALHDNGQQIKFTVGEGKGQYNSFAHGYAMTVHKSQGETVDRVFVLPSESMSSREWSYVSMSRNRFEARLYATHDSIETLTKTMGRAQGKDTSLDYKLAQPEKPATLEKPAAVEKTDAPELATSHDREVTEASPSTKKENAPKALDTVSISRHVADKAVDAADLTDKQKGQIKKALDVAELAAHIKTGNLGGAIRKAEDLQKTIHEEGLAP
jgi:Ti-type conjugative transfer relaxase TraA